MRLLQKGSKPVFSGVLAESLGSLWGSEIYPVLWDTLSVREGDEKGEMEVWFLSFSFSSQNLSVHTPKHKF